MTALIPAYAGAALVLLGLIALTGSAARKHAMHAAAAVGLIAMIGAPLSARHGARQSHFRLQQSAD